MIKTLTSAAVGIGCALALAATAQAAPVPSSSIQALAQAGIATPVYQPWPPGIFVDPPSPPPAGWLWGWTCPATADQQTCEDFWFTFDY